MSFKSSSLLIVSLVILLSCSKKKMQGVIDGDDIIPPKPPFWEYFTVLGFDEDNDGVRDDYELYVNENFDDINVRRALKYEAKIIAGLMRSVNYEEINGLFFEMHNALICTGGLLRSKRYPINKDISTAEKMLNNTWRVNQFNKIEKYLNVRSYPGGRSSIIFELNHCRFKLENLKMILQPFMKNSNYKKNQTPEEIKEFERIMGIK